MTSVSTHDENTFLIRFAHIASTAPVRMLVYFLAIAALAVCATLLTNWLVPPAPSAWHQLVMIKNVSLPFAIFAAYAKLVQLLEQRPVEEIAIRGHWMTLIPGMLIGGSIMVLFVATLWAVSKAHLSPGSGLAGLFSELLRPTVTALGEELLFRVIVFRLAEEMTGTFIAIVLSAALFGLAHSANPNATPLDLILLSAMGVLLALAFALTRNIWLPVGIHMSWNFTEGFVFGLNNSGTTDPNSFWRTYLSGPDWLTGGNFGPEGSFVLLGLTLLASAIFTIWIFRKNHWRPARLSWAAVSIFAL